jgi:hypothetical protein
LESTKYEQKMLLICNIFDPCRLKKALIPAFGIAFFQFNFKKEIVGTKLKTCHDFLAVKCHSHLNSRESRIRISRLFNLHFKNNCKVISHFANPSLPRVTNSIGATPSFIISAFFLLLLRLISHFALFMLFMPMIYDFLRQQSILLFHFFLIPSFPDHLLLTEEKKQQPGVKSRQAPFTIAKE